MKQKKIPMRMCSVTRERFPKQELLRVASCFNNCITTNAILEDYNDKKN